MLTLRVVRTIRVGDALVQPGERIPGPVAGRKLKNWLRARYVEMVFEPDPEPAPKPRPSAPRESLDGPPPAAKPKPKPKRK